ncbi:MAG: hypothetical protein A2252_03895 [Elusimicrobia bacterium RIFOXYA2_FULL_39_19]|nr:MAG: hypothetical protein A2252_03895 [Elusimicrobia bacterium RIFOXYA2_FULL_39_19]
MNFIIPQKQTGFTLIEMMVVIAIIAILSVVAITQFMGMTDKAKVASTKGYLSTLRSSSHLYYADESGIFPYQLAALTETDTNGNSCLYFTTPIQKENNAWVPKYMNKWIPKIRTGSLAWGLAGTDNGHEEGNSIKIVNDSHAPKVNVDWPAELIYNRDNGEVWINSELTDKEGVKISDW